MRLNLTAAAFLVLLSGCAKDASPDAALDQRLLACADLADSAERASCFETLAAERRTGDVEPVRVAKAKATDTETGAATEPVAKDPAEAAVDAFGAEQTTAARAAARERDKQGLSEIIVAVDKVRRNARGGAVFVLENAQVWEQAGYDTTTVRWDEDDEWTVRIRRRRMGGYDLRILDLNRSLDVRRVK